MHFEGMVNIEAPRDKVWGFLTDPDKVSQCAPGLQSMEVIVPDEKFRAVASVGFGSVKATFDTEVEWVDLEEPDFAKMKAHGKAPGSGVDATASMTLTDGSNGTTDLTWVAEISIVGSIASLASRLMKGVCNNLTTVFFNCVKTKIEE